MTAADQLADARCQLGLSLADISSRTKVSVERLSAVERADPTALPPFVYLKGFVRAFAAEVHLDPELIWRQYLSELPNPLEPVSLDEPLVIAPRDADALEEFDSENDRAEPTPPQPSFAEVTFLPSVGQPTRAAGSEPLAAAETAVLAPIDGPEAPAARKSFLLVFVLATVAAFVGAYLWTANMTRDAPRSDARQTSGPVGEPDPSSPASAPTKGEPSLSPPMNTDRGRSQPAQQAPPAADTGRSPLQTDARSYTPAAQSDSIRSETRNAAGRPSAGPRSDSTLGRGAVGDQSRAGAPTSAADREPPTTGGTAGHADTVSGAWNFSSKVESATVADYQNLMLGFQVDLEQRGNRVVGQGRKVSENGVVLPERRRTPIQVEGTLEGNRLALDFTEVGARRKSAGHFLLYLAEDGSFRGRFRSEAAKSAGVTVAVRQ